MRLLAALLASMLLAGCQASPTLDRLRGEDVVPEPVYLERRADVGPQHDARYEVPVGDRAASLNVTLALATRAPLLAGSAPAARLDVELVSPSGDVLHRGTVDGARPTFSLLSTELSERGAYVVRVHGQGVAETLQGQGYGASYVLTMEVLHA